LTDVVETHFAIEVLSPEFYLEPLSKSAKRDTTAMEFVVCTKAWAIPWSAGDGGLARWPTVYDPEIPADIYEIGLIYRIDIADDRTVKVDMSLTSPNCPSAQELPVMVQNAVSTVPGVGKVDVRVVWDPPWDPSRMSEEARVVLNMLWVTFLSRSPHVAGEIQPVTIRNWLGTPSGNISGYPFIAGVLRSSLPAQRCRLHRRGASRL
jgi:FeS assembly SUF system protein